MTTFEWKILEIKANNEIINGAKYFVFAKDGEFIVETEGYCDIPFVEILSTFDTVTEEQVIGWIKKETMIIVLTSIS